MYNEADCVEELLLRLYKILETRQELFEIIAIDNGSSDDTAAILKSHGVIFEKLENFSSLKIIQLIRNFGYDSAVITGIEHSSGDKAVIMDGDLQDPPEVIPHFLAKSYEGYDVVYGKREKRTEGFFISLFIKIYYFIWSRIYSKTFPDKGGNFGVIDRNVIDLIKSLPEREIYFRGLRAWVASNSIGLVYTRHKRTKGKTKFSFLKYVIYGINGITSFTVFPIRAMTITGIIGIFISFLLGFIITISKIQNVLGVDPTNSIAPGWSSLALLILISISLNLFCLGVIGEYVGRIYQEVKGRPRVVVRKTDLISGPDPD
jgi:dolichol-phosphate mannosyltransferase